MATYAKNCLSTIIPCLRYGNALPMIDWLCQTFGFTKKEVHTAADGIVLHAELVFGNGMIMIGSAANRSIATGFSHQPDEVGGTETQSPYLVVSDCDAVYASAKAAGAEIVIDLKEQDYGGKSFSCRDPEKHLWHVGSYDPWATASKT